MLLKIGYNHFHFTSAEDAIETLELIARSTSVEYDYSTRTFYKSATPDIGLVGSPGKLEPTMTVEEFKEKSARAEQDRLDTIRELEQRLRDLRGESAPTEQI